MWGKTRTAYVLTAVIAAVCVVLTATSGAGTELGRSVFASSVMQGSAPHDLGTSSVGGVSIDDAVGRATADLSIVPQSTPGSQIDPETGTGASDGHSTRVGGSDPAPKPAKPAWVWWVAGAFVVMLGAGGFRLWRSTQDGAHRAEDD